MTDAVATAGRPPVFSERYKSTVLGLLVVAYTLNFIDRTIISTIGEAIKVDLRISDTQLGLLGGLYFALLYTFLGVPIARLAERYSRVNIISIAILVWSGFTALCGAAQNFVMLAAFRFGVGVGEAGLSPPAHSLISDYYEPQRRASALAVYAFGIPLGGMIGAVAGGWLAQTFNWHIAFMVVGVPGIIIAALIKFVIKEPPRGHSDRVEAAHRPEDVTPEVHAPPPFSIRQELSEMDSVAKVLFGIPPVLHMILGVTLASFAGYGAGQYSSNYFIRTFGLNYAEVGLIFGIIGGVSSGLGTLVGGFVADRLSARSPAWYSLTPAIGLAVATPIYMFAYTLPSWQIAAAILLIPGIFHYTYLGPTFGVVQNMVPLRRRATATAIMFLFLNLIALGGGPLFTGWLIDHFGQVFFAHGGDRGPLAGLAGLFNGQAGGHEYLTACPGGRPAAGASAALGAQCHEALVGSTRWGLIVTFFFYLWAAFHYLLGSIGLTRALERARAQHGGA
jgi:MFS family permease